MFQDIFEEISKFAVSRIYKYQEVQGGRLFNVTVFLGNESPALNMYQSLYCSICSFTAAITSNSFSTFGTPYTIMYMRNVNNSTRNITVLHILESMVFLSCTRKNNLFMALSIYGSNHWTAEIVIHTIILSITFNISNVLKQQVLYNDLVLSIYQYILSILVECTIFIYWLSAK